MKPKALCYQFSSTPRLCWGQIEVEEDQMRIAILVDTPNITRAVHQLHGKESQADYRKLLQVAARLGTVVCAKALINDGLPLHQVTKLQSTGLGIVRSHSFDCDDTVVAWAVRLHEQADCFLLCSGDKHFSSLVTLLRQIGRKVVVCAVRTACSRKLRSLSSEYVEMPVLCRSLASSTCAYPSSPC
jgi:uncharacterized LabA/DUF88 family protein